MNYFTSLLSWQTWESYLVYLGLCSHFEIILIRLGVIRRKVRIAMLGLDNSGKTLLVTRLAGRGITMTPPTVHPGKQQAKG